MPRPPVWLRAGAATSPKATQNDSGGADARRPPLPNILARTRTMGYHEIADSFGSSGSQPGQDLLVRHTE